MSARALYWLHRTSLRGSADSLARGLLASLHRGRLPDVSARLLQALPRPAQAGVVSLNLQNSRGMGIPVSLRGLEFPGKTSKHGLLIGDGTILPIEAEDWARGAEHSGTLVAEHPHTRTRSVHVLIPREPLAKLGATFRGSSAYLRVKDELWEQLHNHRRLGDFTHAFANVSNHLIGQITADQLRARTGLTGPVGFRRYYAAREKEREFVELLFAQPNALRIEPLLREHFKVRGPHVNRASRTLSRNIKTLQEHGVLGAFARHFSERERR